MVRLEQSVHIAGTKTRRKLSNLLTGLYTTGTLSGRESFARKAGMSPGESEWNELIDNLGGTNYAGGSMKERGTDYWVEPNTGATNESGFSALPGGFRYRDGKFFDFGFSGYWWTSKEYSSARAYFIMLYYNESVLNYFNNTKQNGFSVRCIMD